MADDNRNNNSGGAPWLLIALLGFMFWRFPKITLTLLAIGAVIVAAAVIMQPAPPAPKSYDANDYLPPSQRCPREDYVNGQPQNVECAGADLARWQELQDKLDKERLADADAQWQQAHKQQAAGGAAN